MPELAGRCNTQVEEQLYRQMGKDSYFLTQMTPVHYLFLLRLVIELNNVAMNLRQSEEIKKTLDKSDLRGNIMTDSCGRITILQAQDKGQDLHTSSSPLESPSRHALGEVKLGIRVILVHSQLCYVLM